MSWGTCYSGSNNIHFDFPPIMSDGRNFANWQPGAAIDESIRRTSNIQTNADYRKYLVSHADEIIKLNQLQACDECCACSGKPAAVNDGTTQGFYNSPYLYKSCVDSTTPFGYENSDLKSAYLTREELQARMVAPVITQDQLIREGFYNPN
jgi:hypothetical protein